MTLLSKIEEKQAVSSVEKLILGSKQTASLLQAVSNERLYGSDDAKYNEIETFPLELIATPPEDLGQKIDATACVLPDLDIHKEDHLRVNYEEYKVQTVKEEHLFGVLTHKVIKLVHIHGR